MKGNGKPNIAIAGATGLVGRTMLNVLEEQGVEYDKLKLLASARSAGSYIEHNGKKFLVEELNNDSFDDIDIALFSCGGETSKMYAPHAVNSRAYVIDNSSAWRMDSSKTLIVPEVNIESLPTKPDIIANPNCSTIQMVVALKPLADMFSLKKVICSTYQSISGAGQSGVDKLKAEIEDTELNKGKRIAYSTLFHSPSENGRTEEENKMVNETRKILNSPDIKVSVNCVRLPILGGHAESIWVETERKPDLEKIKEVYRKTSGIEYSDRFIDGEYPTPETCADRDEVFVSRLKHDDIFENGLSMWVVADNLRKGAATNAVQIAKALIDRSIVS